MNGPGRPSNEAVAERRHKVRLFLVLSAQKSDEAVQIMAERLDVGPRTIRADLDAIRRELESGDPRDLIDAIRTADPHRLKKSLVMALKPTTTPDQNGGNT